MSGSKSLRGCWGLALSAAAALIALICLAVVLATGQSTTPAPTTPSAPPSSATATSHETPAPRSEPASVEIPKIGADSTLVRLGLNPDNTLEVPPVSRPMQAGWYALGPAPGEKGPAVVVGHVDGNKEAGIFFRLKELVPGDQIAVTRKDGTKLVFVVSRVAEVAKDRFPTDAVYGDTPGPELRLITCGGSFDRAARSYRDNIIVYAALRR
ncbi:class F sortase [Amycolatopsis samaneae]|uniref:Class F sortase n=1 Tax=Amycolatopsis samaneae TaxID=664691 RepID=A0ABW5GRK6_9PSEU